MSENNVLCEGVEPSKFLTSPEEQGILDSNQCMTTSKAVTLPLGECPMYGFR